MLQRSVERFDGAAQVFAQQICKVLYMASSTGKGFLVMVPEAHAKQR